MNQEPPLETLVPSPKVKKERTFLGETIRFIIIAAVIVLPIRYFVAQPFIVEGSSMDPTFATKQYLIVDQLSYHLGDPVRGQVVIFRYPKDPSQYFIKRVIGLPGETVVLKGTQTTIKNAQNPDGFTLNEPYVIQANEIDNDQTVSLKPGEYFVMGDNRRDSFDSRAWGPVPRKNMIGTPFLRLFPIDKISLSPGYYKEAK